LIPSIAFVLNETLFYLLATTFFKKTAALVLSFWRVRNTVTLSQSLKYLFNYFKGYKKRHHALTHNNQKLFFDFGGVQLV
jgi:hypothetical protein